MSKRYVRHELSPNVQDASRGQDIIYFETDGPVKYGKKKWVEVYKGYDFLENLYVIRDFVQKKNRIDQALLELMLKLMGMKVFTRSEYNALPKQFTYKKLQKLIDEGLVNLISDHAETDKRVFTLSTKGRNIVMSLYEYLSGEKRIPETAHENPLAKTEKEVAFDKKKMNLIRKLNQDPVPRHKRKLFE